MLRVKSLKNIYLNVVSFDNIYLKSFKVFSLFLNFKFSLSLVFFFKKFYSLSYYYSFLILTKFGLPKNIKLNYLNIQHFLKIFFFFDFFFKQDSDVKFLISFFQSSVFRFLNYKSFRLFKGLPVRGQRTSSNAKSCRSLLFHKKLISTLSLIGLKFN